MLIIIKNVIVNYLLRDRALMIGFKIVKIIIKVNASSRRFIRTRKTENKGLEQYIPGKF